MLVGHLQAIWRSFLVPYNHLEEGAAMHSHRVWALIGVLLGVLGLFMKAATSNGEELMGQFAQAVPDFPDGLPTIWGGLDTWAQVVLVVLIVIVAILALKPPLSAPMSRVAGIELTVIGVALFAYAIVKWMDASNSASDLTDAFAQLASAGAAPEAFTASANPIGFVLLLVGTAIVALTGVMTMMRKSTPQSV